jgi:hypothetical protein
MPEIRNWQGAEEEDDHTAGEREEDETTITNNPRAYDMSSGWGRPRPKFFDLLPDQNTKVNDRNVEDGVPAESPPLVNHLFLGGNLGEPTTVPRPMEITSTSNPKASTASNEASNGPRPTTRAKGKPQPWIRRSWTTITRNRSTPASATKMKHMVRGKG